MNNIIINGEPVIARGGETILEAARKVGVHIPTLCYLRERSGVASCRVCVVEIEGEPYPVPACSTPVRDGMEITTDSPKLAAYRKLALELILSSKGAALAAVARGDDAGETELSRLCAELGVEPPAATDGADELPTVEGNPFLSYDPNLCIECQRCVGACNSAARNHSLQSRMRGSHVLIDAPFGPDWRATDCESCGNCAQACPTGALSLKRSRGAAERPAAAAGIEASIAAGDAPIEQAASRFVRTTCPHCGVGCQLELEVRGGRIVGARGAQGASNRSLLCVKGRSASFDFVGSPDRLTSPLIRNRATGELKPATWDEALDLVATRFAQLRDEHGGRSIAAFACSRSTNEDVYLFEKMARTALRSNNIDSCARV